MTIPIYRAARVRHIVICLMVLMLASCAQPLKKPTTITNPQIAYEVRQEQIRQISQWQLRARIAIRTPEDANTGSMYWQQSNEQVQIDLNGPFGVTVAKIYSADGQYRLKDRQGQLWQAEDIDRLIYNRTGWFLPIARLRYWLLADTQNTFDANFVYNPDGTLASLDYQQWQITYQSYTDVDGVKLPSKMRIVHPDVAIKLTVRNWQTQYD